MIDLYLVPFCVFPSLFICFSPHSIILLPFFRYSSISHFIPSFLFSCPYILCISFLSSFPCSDSSHSLAISLCFLFYFIFYSQLFIHSWRQRNPDSKVKARQNDHRSLPDYSSVCVFAWSKTTDLLSAEVRRNMICMH